MVRLSIVNVTKLLLSLHNFSHLLFGHTHYIKKTSLFSVQHCCSINDPSEAPGNESTRRITLFMKDLQGLNLPPLKLFLFYHRDSPTTLRPLSAHCCVSPPE